MALSGVSGRLTTEQDREGMGNMGHTAVQCPVAFWDYSSMDLGFHGFGFGLGLGFGLALLGFGFGCMAFVFYISNIRIAFSRAKG